MTMKDPGYAGARWDGEQHDGHTESWFFKANAPDGERALWLKWTLFQSARDARGNGAPTRAIAEAWAVAFSRGGQHVAVKSSAPASSARFAREELDVRIDGLRLGPRVARGAIESGGRAVAVDLAIDGRGGPFVAYHDAWMRGRFPSQKLCSPVVDARVTGTARIDGAVWDLAAWPAMIGHNWGPRHTPEYAWLHCNSWDEDIPLVVECASGRTRVGPVLAPFATIAWARLGGEELRMTSPLSIARNRATVSPHAYTVKAYGGGASLVLEAASEHADTVGLLYPNPSGAPTYCLNSKLARARVTLRTPGGKTLIATSRAAALEIGTLDPTHGVRMVL